MAVAAALLSLLSGCALIPEAQWQKNRRIAREYDRTAHEQGWDKPAVAPIRVNPAPGETPDPCAAYSVFHQKVYSDNEFKRALQKKRLWPLGTEVVFVFRAVGLECLTPKNGLREEREGR